jgi:hypothetical protein
MGIVKLESGVGRFGAVSNGRDGSVGGGGWGSQGAVSQMGMRYPSNRGIRANEKFPRVWCLAPRVRAIFTRWKTFLFLGYSDTFIISY